MVGVVYVIITKDEACSSYSKPHARFYHIGGRLYLGIPSKIFNAQKYFNLYKLACCMSSNPVLTVVAIFRGGVVKR